LQPGPLLLARNNTMIFLHGHLTTKTKARGRGIWPRPGAAGEARDEIFKKKRQKD
jgi:hypothetical protein